jgi:Ni,Fe-hydrogenase III small subunit/Pyruvate/2-oxoacid:ferredoxin oxidoreductase delta subunit
MPRYSPEHCTDACQACADVCPTRAIAMRHTAEQGNGKAGHLDIDYGRCVVCQLCTEACPTDAMTPSSDWAFGAAHRQDLVWRTRPSAASAPADKRRRSFRRSLHIRHVDAGSCNGCESELQALNNPFYNLHRLGIFFTASPRFADLLLVTGPLTNAMLTPLRATYEAMPEPRWVMAIGTCAVSGGIAEGGYASGHGLDGVISVDVYLPGCPPNPAAIIHALLMFLDRVPQRVSGGRLDQ